MRLRPREYLGWGILILYSLFLVYRNLYHPTDEKAASILLWELRDWRCVADWMLGCVFATCCDLTYFIPVGFGAALLVPHRSGWFRRSAVNFPGLATGGTLAILICATGIVNARCRVAIIGLVFPLAGCVLGAWAGTAWLRGWRACLWFVPKVALLVCLVVLCLGGMVWLVLEDAPLLFEIVPVTSGDKRRLADLADRKNPASLGTGQTHTLQLTEHDLNVISSWGLSSLASGRKAKVSIDQNSASVLISAPVPLGKGRACYLNLRMTGGAEIEDGVLRARLSGCQIGSVRVPNWLLRPLCPLLTSFLNHDARFRPFLDATRRMTIEPNSIQLTYGPVDLPAAVRSRLFGSAIANEELLVSTRAQANCLLLVAAVRQLFDPQPSFELCVKTAFTLARDRSVRRNPIAENQAAILALGMFIGHPRVGEFLGPVATEGEGDPARRSLDRVVVHGRSDWAKHFCVSAAIAVLMDGAISDAAALLKEELDADTGGSGFSFADLLADRAGTAFALAATRDEAAARAIQHRLARGFCIEDVIPSPDDLPEGISEAELQSDYGGIGGNGYRRLIEEIDRRIARCVTGL